MYKAVEERNIAVAALRKAVDAKKEVSNNMATIARAGMVEMRIVVTETETLIGEQKSITEGEYRAKFSALMERHAVTDLKTSAAVADRNAANAFRALL